MADVKYVKTEDGYRKKVGQAGSGEYAEVFNDVDHNVASGDFSHAEGMNTAAYGEASHVEGIYSGVYGDYAHAEGYNTTASGHQSHTEGHQTTSLGRYSHTEGYSTNKVPNNITSESAVSDIISAWNSEKFTLAHGWVSHSEGHNTLTLEGYCHTEGYNTIALYSQHAQGHNNNITTATSGSISGTTGTAFVIGNGTQDSASNAFRVTYAGETYAKSTYNTTGADYAEFFEWSDGNPNAEDRRGYFVTLDGDKIKVANSGDYILGIISGNPSVIGNSDEEWMGRYVMDEFGSFITEEFEYEEEVHETVMDEETKEPKTITHTVTKTGTKYKENPDYDNTRAYTQRADRPEWSAVGMLGVLSVRDDGTCRVNGYCTVADGGIATAANSGYRVINRVNENIVKVIFR